MAVSLTSSSTSSRVCYYLWSIHFWESQVDLLEHNLLFSSDITESPCNFTLPLCHKKQFWSPKFKFMVEIGWLDRLSISYERRNKTVIANLTHWGRAKIATISQTTFSNTFSYTLSREYRVVRNRYSRLLFTSEDRLCANLRVQEQSTNMTS